ncbi:hypothetical protein COX84_01605 [Candidatus Micrarchaeota archaeon CG_4_10_14_0_2_um_filter_49_7]|nr:MAG: hypothetical protein AUJ13_04575 [Candidatus Micrarchaeota archaeon CG1_02_49_24]PIZ98844.1 MAG: hypothetical protein COX84_01605 [Candidatus Micrarchaeota archaeon CG_4_10_14_0_2_um_filter_49_7]HII54387.1 hypothetical protein [Candidatus Micrarchaeota archaeon]
MFYTIDFAQKSIRKNLIGYAVLSIYGCIYTLVFLFGILGILLLASFMFYFITPQYYLPISEVLLVIALGAFLAIKGAICCACISSLSSLAQGNGTGFIEFLERALGFFKKTMKVALIQLALLLLPIVPAFLLMPRVSALTSNIVATAVMALAVIFGVFMAFLMHYSYYGMAAGGSIKKGLKGAIIHYFVSKILAFICLIIPFLGWLLLFLYVKPFFMLGNIAAARGSK